MTVRQRRWLLVLPPMVVAGLPCKAQAHMAMTGLGPLFDAFDAVALDVENFIPLAVLGLFLGLRGAASARWSALAALLGWIVGGMAAMLLSGGALDGIRPVTAPALMLIVGGSLSANLALPRNSCLGLALTAAVMRALATFSDQMPPELQLPAIAFSALVAFFIVCLAASITLPLRARWSIVIAQVAGSWTAALGLILIGWLLRGPGS